MILLWGFDMEQGVPIVLLEHLKPLAMIALTEPKPAGSGFGKNLPMFSQKLDDLFIRDLRKVVIP